MNDSGTILVADDERDMCELLVHLLEQEGFEAAAVHNGNDALESVRSKRPDLLLLDVRMPGLNGIEVLRRARELLPDLAVIMMTAYADVPGAIEAMRSGASDYIAKPFDHHEVIRMVRRALSEQALKQQIRNMSTQLRDSVDLRKMMGPSDTVGRIIDKVNRVAKSDFTVIILGETGVGKELAARAIHHASHRSGGAFVAIDCGAIPETLIESELFGHEKGAFTGAINRKQGKFETARGGTLLLDEISNMTLGAQAKLLRALQERVIYRVGSVKPFEIDVRVLVSSNQDLAAPTGTGTFRKDLYYRLNDFTIRIPPLRERRQDIPYLAQRFLEATNIELGKQVEGYTDEAMEALLACDWPGNVRQLRTTVRRAVLMADHQVAKNHLHIDKTAAPVMRPEPAPGNGERPWERFSLKEIIARNTRALEREVLEQVLRHTGGNKAKAARLLKIDYKTMHNKVKQLGITLP